MQGLYAPLKSKRDTAPPIFDFNSPSGRRNYAAKIRTGLKFGRHILWVTTNNFDV